MTTFGAWRDSLIFKGPNNNGYGGPDFESLCFGIWGPRGKTYRNSGIRPNIASGAVAGATRTDVGGYNGVFASVGRYYDYPVISYSAWDFSDGGVATLTLPAWVEAGDTILGVIHGSGPGPDLPAGWTLVDNYAGAWGAQMLVSFVATGPSQIISWTYNGSGCGQWAMGGIVFQGAATFAAGASNEDVDGGGTFTTVGGSEFQAMFTGEGYANHGMVLDSAVPAGTTRGGAVANVISVDVIHTPGSTAALTFEPWTGSNDYDRSVAITVTGTQKIIGSAYYEQGAFYADTSYIEYPLDRDAYGRDYMDNRWLNGIRADPNDPEVSDPDFIGYCYEDQPHNVVAPDAGSSSYPFEPYIYYAFGEYDPSTGSYGKGVKRATEMDALWLDIEIAWELMTGSASEKAQVFKLGFVPPALRDLNFEPELDGDANGVDGIRCGHMHRVGQVSLPAWVRSQIPWVSLGSFDSPNGIPVDRSQEYGFDASRMKTVRWNGWTTYEPGSDRVKIPYAQLVDHTVTLLVTAAGQDNSSTITGLAGEHVEARVTVGKVRGLLSYQPIMRWRPAFKDPTLDAQDVAQRIAFTPA